MNSDCLFTQLHNLKEGLHFEAELKKKKKGYTYHYNITTLFSFKKEPQQTAKRNP